MFDLRFVFIFDHKSQTAVGETISRVLNEKYSFLLNFISIIVYKVMKRNLSKQSNREKNDKVERKASIAGTSINEKSSKRRLSIYDDFEDDDMEEFDPKFVKNMKYRR
jgi:hypothetical protein